MAVAAVGWLLGRLRADAESGLWAALKGLVVGDPLTVALEDVTGAALEAAVRAAPRGGALSEDDVREVVAVLGQVWQGLDLGEVAPTGSLLGRLVGVTADAMVGCVAPVEGLGSGEPVSSLSVLERDYGVVLNPEQFGLDLAYAWQRGVRDLAVTNPVLAPLAAELRDEVGHELTDAAREEVMAKLAELPTTRVMASLLDRLGEQVSQLMAGQQAQLPGPGRAGEFPQFVGVPDRNPGFVGRHNELHRLEAVLSEDDPTVITQVAAGLGGVGKTALAAEFCHRHRQSVDVVRWLHAEARETLLSAFTAMGPALGLNLAGLGADDAVAIVRRWFETTDRSWLLVFDNVETPNVLDGLVPTAGPGRVLVTSRYQDWAHRGVRVLGVDVLEFADAVDLLTRQSGCSGPGAAGAEDLVGWLGRLALAVEQAGAFCRQTGWDFPRYQRQLKQRAGELLARNPAALRRLPGGNGLDMIVLTVWDNSLERAGHEAPGAQAVISVLAYLGADHVPRALLGEAVAADEVLLAGGDELWVDDALAALARYSLVELHRGENGTVLAVSVHRLLQEVTRLSHDEHTGNEAAGTAIRLLRRTWPANSIEPEAWPLCQFLEPHLTATVAHATRLGIEHEAVSWAFERYGIYLQYSGNPAVAPHAFERAVQIQAELQHNDDPTLLVRIANLATSYRAAGRVADAIALQERVLAEYERTLGDDHPNTLASRNNLAHSYQSAGRVPEAIALQERVLAECERTLGDDDPGTLMARANLAHSYWLAGRVSYAIALQEGVLTDREQILGNDHPDTLTARANLATSYGSAGRMSEATALEEGVLADRARVQGDSHPDTLAARANLATSYGSAGRVAEATALQERVLADSERILGDEHPDTLRARANLASSYWSTDRVAEAIALLERVVADSERVLGDDHPDTLASRNNLAHSYRSAGRVADATALQERVLADSERILGDEHPDTLRARANLASSYWSTDRVAEAIALLERVVADSERVLGDDHPDTLVIRANLAHSYRSAGRVPEATALQERVLADSERILGDEHPDTLTARADLAVAYKSAGRVPEAIALQERVVADSERVLGDDHPNTLTGRADLAVAYKSAGRVPEAIALQERVVADSERVLDDDHPTTLVVRNNLAQSYWSAGRVPEAIALQERVVADSERVLDDDHPTTLAARANLANSYRSAGRVAEAIVLEERVVADSERVLGDDHPTTLVIRGNLAGSYWSAGRVSEAIGLQERVLADCERILGDQHPDVLLVRQTLDRWRSDT